LNDPNDRATLNLELLNSERAEGRLNASRLKKVET